MGSYTTLQEFSEGFAPQNTQLVIMDYHLPGGDALTTGTQLKQNHPDVQLIFLTGTQSAVILKQLVNSDADGVLHKEVTPDELERAIDTLILGGKAYSEQVIRKLSPGDALFTSREFQTFRLLAQGLSTKQVASSMSISTRTAEKHRENLFRKANVKNLAQLIELGYKWQILDLEAGS